MKSFLPALVLAVLIPAASASTILGGSGSFNLTGQNEFSDLYHFSLPFLYGTHNGNKQPFALFSIEADGNCARPFPDYNFSCGPVGPFSVGAALSKNQYRQGLTVENNYTDFSFQPFEFDPNTLTVQVPLSYSIGWQLKSATGQNLDYIFAAGSGMGILHLDSAFRLISGSFNFAPSTDDINSVNNPEPGTLLLFSTGVGLIAWAKRRKKQKEQNASA
jgi:hypothetical protein